MGTSQDNVDSRRNPEKASEKFYLNSSGSIIVMTRLSFNWNYSLAIVDQCEEEKKVSSTNSATSDVEKEIIMRQVEESGSLGFETAHDETPGHRSTVWCTWHIAEKK